MQKTTTVLPPRNERAEPQPAPVDAEIDSRALMGARDRVAIRHGGALYWLRATRQGKLLLTK